jgi:hypothetical protein
MDEFTFDNSIYKLRPIYYHFLDGYLDENVGFNTNDTLNFIKTYISQFINSNIVCENILNYSSTKFVDDLQNNKYIVLQQGHDNHATSFVFFYKK